MVQVPGYVRLAIELLVFGGATFALVVAHYAWSYERVGWLLKQ